MGHGHRLPTALSQVSQRLQPCSECGTHRHDPAARGTVPPPHPASAHQGRRSCCYGGTNTPPWFHEIRDHFNYHEYYPPMMVWKQLFHGSGHLLLLPKVTPSEGAFSRCTLLPRICEHVHKNSGLQIAASIIYGRKVQATRYHHLLDDHNIQLLHLTFLQLLLLHFNYHPPIVFTNIS